MAETTSLAFPNMFNIASNQVGVLEDAASVANRTRLLILSDPTELYNNPNFGVGLSSHLWHYNNDAERGLVKDKIVQQLRLYEPCVYPDKTQFSDSLTFTEATTPEHNTMALTVALQTVFKDDVEITLNSDSSVD